MIGIFQNNNNQNSVVQEYLPTPQISSVGAKDKGFYHSINQLNWRNQAISDVLNITFNTFSGNVDNNTFTFTSFLSYSDIKVYITSKTIDETTYPFLFGTNYEKKILQASDNNVYARYFDGTNDINVLIP